MAKKHTTEFWKSIASTRADRKLTAGMSDRNYILHYSQPEPNSGCWLWLAAINNTGYGIGRRKDGTRLAPRLSYIAFNDVIQNGMEVLHKCDNPICVNPDHLFVGTHIENVKDMHRKGRNYRGGRHHWSRLTDDQVRQIRDAEGTHHSIAKRFGVTQSTVTRFKNGGRRAYN